VPLIQKLTLKVEADVTPFRLAPNGGSRLADFMQGCSLDNIPYLTPGCDEVIDSGESSCILIDRPWLIQRSPNTLLWRKCFPALFHAISHSFRQTSAVILAGSSGVGKSQYLAIFVMYITYCLRKPVVIDIEDGAFGLIDPLDPTFVHFANREKDAFGSILRRLGDEIYYVFDCRGPAFSPVMPLEFGPAINFIASASPSRLPLLEGHLKGFRPYILYVPPWSWHEIEHLRSSAPEFSALPSSFVADLFALYGGCVRSCLPILPPRRSAPDFEFMLRAEKVSLGKKINESDPAHILEYFRRTSAVVDKQDAISHSLFLLHPTDSSFLEPAMAFCSDYVRDRLMTLAGFQARNRFRDSLVHNNSPQFATVRGQAFEFYCHTEFRRFSGARRVVQLFPNGSSSPCPLELPTLTVSQSFDTTMELKCSEGSYYIPRSRTFAAVDALIPPRTLLQFTINTKHGVNANGLIHAKKLLGVRSGNINVVFVCPPEVVDDFKWQGLLGAKGQVLQKVPADLKHVTVNQFVTGFGWSSDSDTSSGFLSPSLPVPE